MIKLVYTNAQPVTPYLSIQNDDLMEAYFKSLPPAPNLNERVSHFDCVQKAFPRLYNSVCLNVNNVGKWMQAATA